jgi:type II secretory pathway pseudopilin PulG
MKMSRSHPRRLAGVSLVEMLVAMAVASMVTSGTLGVFLFSLRTMCRDSQRLETNATLRSFVGHVSKKTLDATEFYLFPNYHSLDGTVDLTEDVSRLEPDTFGTFLAHGDCLALVTRSSASNEASNVLRLRIYYRVATDPKAIAPIRFYENDYGSDGSASSLTALLNAINLRATPAIAGSRELVAQTRGRLMAASPDRCYPIFATESSSATPVNESVSINVEVINGKSALQQLSSSSFNYTVSPRR